MRRNGSNTLRTAAIAAGTSVAIALTAQMSIAAPSAVEQLVGSWGGSGRIHYTDGTSEGISCNAYYTGGGNELSMAIQCRSEKNPIHIRSKLRVSGSNLSGSWEERTFNASGTASGVVGGSSITLNVSGGGFTGTMDVSVRSSSHKITISTQGIAMSRATMDFRKR
jgi:hypothetical protein